MGKADGTPCYYQLPAVSSWDGGVHGQKVDCEDDGYHEEASCCCCWTVFIRWERLPVVRLVFAVVFLVLVRFRIAAPRILLLLDPTPQLAWSIRDIQQASKYISVFSNTTWRMPLLPSCISIKYALPNIQHPYLHNDTFSSTQVSSFSFLSSSSTPVHHHGLSLTSAMMCPTVELVTVFNCSHLSHVARPQRPLRRQATPGPESVVVTTQLPGGG
eukprot:748199-Hanusia_phi.AAC.3